MKYEIREDLDMMFFYMNQTLTSFSTGVLKYKRDYGFFKQYILSQQGNIVIVKVEYLVYIYNKLLHRLTPPHYN